MDRPRKFVKLTEVLKELQSCGKCTIDDRLPVDLDSFIEIPSDEIISIANLFKHLGEQNKLRILLLLKSGPLPVCVISYLLKLDQTLVSHHLKSLREAGLVEPIRVNKFRLYKLTEKARKIIDSIPTLVM